MNKRRPADYGPFLKDVVEKVNAYLEAGEKNESDQIQLYWSIGEAICARPERSAAVVLSEELARAFPEEKGFSPRNVRRMREFYRTYADQPELVTLALQVGWTSNVLIMEHCTSAEAREAYLRAVRRTGWSKAELLRSFDNPGLPEEGASDLTAAEKPRKQPVSAKGAVSDKETGKPQNAPCEAPVPVCEPSAEPSSLCPEKEGLSPHGGKERQGLLRQDQEVQRGQRETLRPEACRPYPKDMLSVVPDRAEQANDIHRDYAPSPDGRRKRVTGEHPDQRPIGCSQIIDGLRLLETPFPFQTQCKKANAPSPNDEVKPPPGAFRRERLLSSGAGRLTVYHYFAHSNIQCANDHYSKSKEVLTAPVVRSLTGDTMTGGELLRSA